MSVIGRLDEQVESVLIRPLSERRGHDAPDTNDAEAKTPTTRDEPPPMDAPENKIKDAKRELPVWLL